MIELNLAIVALIFSIIFSSAEFALISANKLQINVWLKQKVALSKYSIKILRNKETFLSVILIGTNISNISATTFATLFLIENKLISEGLVIIPITIIILFFGEILPKNFVISFPSHTLLYLSPILIFFEKLFYPVLIVLDRLKIKGLESRLQYKVETIDKERLSLMKIYENTNDTDVIEDDEKEMISNVFDFSTHNINEVMTPRTNVSSVSISDSLENILHKFIESGHSKLPVFKKNLDNIIGIIYFYDFFKYPENIDDIIKPIQFIPYSKSIIDTMDELQRNNETLAIILDEHGGTIGLVTIEDIFEELFGEFYDEFDNSDTKLKHNSDGSIICDGNTEYEDLNKRFGLNIPEGNYETISGYVTSNIGRIPNSGEHLFLPSGQYVIKKSNSRKIELIKIYPN